MTPGLKLLASKTNNLEKFQYLTHLRSTNVHLFYRLLAENVKVGLEQDGDRSTDMLS